MSFQRIIDDYIALTKEETHAITDPMIEEHKTSNIIDSIIIPVQQKYVEDQTLLMRSVAIHKLSLKQAAEESREAMMAYLHAMIVVGRLIERLHQEKNAKTQCS